MQQTILVWCMLRHYPRIGRSSLTSCHHLLNLNSNFTLPTTLSTNQRLQRNFHTSHQLFPRRIFSSLTSFKNNGKLTENKNLYQKRSPRLFSSQSTRNVKNSFDADSSAAELERIFSNRIKTRSSVVDI